MKQHLLIAALTLFVALPGRLPADGHWSFRKPVGSSIPDVRDPAWVRTPIDSFILARLEKAGLKPSPPADRATLLRRVTIDLTGLPPTPEELNAFLSDTRPDAYERVVDKLLASPHYGERWAQHWLDVARYAESNGYELDAERPHAWRYRDYVIRSFNDDKPYDRFLTEQIAGDLLAAGNTKPMAELLIATGFHRCGPIHLVSGNTDPDVNRQEVLTEMVIGVGSAFLGLTVQCARCHDHKFDPIPQKDYYRLQAFFAGSELEDKNIYSEQEKAEREKIANALKAKLDPLRKQVTDLDEPYRKRLKEKKRAALDPAYREAVDTPAAKRTKEQEKLAENAKILLNVSWDEVIDALTPADRERRAAWRAQIHVLDAQMPPPLGAAWCVQEAVKTPPTHILKRGNPKNKGAEVSPDTLGVLPPLRKDEGERRKDEGGRIKDEVKKGEEKPSDSPVYSRRDLAAWLTRPDHPLTARVMVNRLWQHHFGRGIVATPNDFGTRGDKPTHPELLDWLACELPAKGWSIKEMHRLMVLSSTYQMSSNAEFGTRNAELKTSNAEVGIRNAELKTPDRNTDSKTTASSIPHSELRTPHSINPDNKLLWRMNRQRLESEALRDCTLGTAGTIYRTLGGPMIRVPLEPEVYDLIFTEGEPDGLWHVTPDAREHTRRGIYLFAKRNVRLPLFEAFDQPDSLTPCPVRPVSTFAPQALILLNGPFAQEQARAFAGRLLRECGSDADRLVERAHLLALSRPPHATERQLGREFLASQADLLRDRLLARERVGLPPDLPTGIDPALAAALVDFCLAMINRNEFVYVQ